MLTDETVDESKVRMNKVVRKNLRVRLGDVVSVHQVGMGQGVAGMRNSSRALQQGACMTWAARFDATAITHALAAHASTSTATNHQFGPWICAPFGLPCHAVN